MGPVGHVEPCGYVSTVESSVHVVPSSRVGSFGHVEPCDCVSTSGLSSCVGLFSPVVVWDHLVV